MSQTAFLFPGQGAQSVGMCQDVANHPVAKALFDEASAVLGYDLLDVCLQGPADRLNATDVSQPAIFVASMAALEHLKQTTPEALQNVTATAGLSLGEYTALTFAGAFTFQDALKVVKARGEAMQSAATARPSGMTAILGIEAGEVQSLVSEARSAGIIEVANFLCPGNTVVSGEQKAIAEIHRLAEAKQLRTIPLAVAGAFHTDLMRPADVKLAEAIESVAFKAPHIPVWSNVDAQPHTDPAEIKQLLVRQVLSPVRWEETLRGLMTAGVDKFYEIGPGRVLAGLIKRINRKTDITNVSV